MTLARTVWYMLPRPVRRLPADLAAVIALTVVTVGAVFLPIVSTTPLRIVLGLPFALFLPGYAFIAALFPEAGASQTIDSETTTDSLVPRPGNGIDGLERIVLSFGLSIAITPLIGLVLNFTPWGIRLAPVVTAISGFILLVTVIAALRRWELPADERFQVSYRTWLVSGRKELFHPDTRTDAVLNVVLVCSLLLAVASVGWAVAVPKQGESFTEVYLLTERENGTLVADNYPTEFVQGEGKSLVVGIGNHEHRAMNYTVVVELQRVQFENNSTRVLEERELRRFQTYVGANKTWREKQTITPTMAGTRLRLIYLLYKGSASSDPSTANAAQEVHLWVNVSTPATAQTRNLHTAHFRDGSQ